jgi:hypothetical protein
MQQSKNEESQTCLDHPSCLKRSSFRPKIRFCPSCGGILEYSCYNSRGWLCLVCVNNACVNFKRLIKLRNPEFIVLSRAGLVIRRKSVESRSKQIGVCLL